MKNVPETPEPLEKPDEGVRGGEVQDGDSEGGDGQVEEGDDEGDGIQGEEEVDEGGGNEVHESADEGDGIQGEEGNDEGNEERGNGRVANILIPGLPVPEEMEFDSAVDLFNPTEGGLADDSDCPSIEPPPIPMGHTFPTAAETIQMYEAQKLETAKKVQISRQVKGNFKEMRLAILESMQIANTFKVCRLHFIIVGLNSFFFLLFFVVKYTFQTFLL